MIDNDENNTLIECSCPDLVALDGDVYKGNRVTKLGGWQMLVLTRRLDESLRIGDDIKITILNLDKKQVDLGISAPKDVAINREEVYKKKQR